MANRSREGAKLVDTYNIEGKTYNVFGCWDKETPEEEYDFYDVYCDGVCINLGEPFWESPTKEDIQEFVNEGLAI